MEDWRVSEELSTEIDGVREVVVRLIAGDVTIAAGPAPRMDIRRESGSDVFVELRDGTLFISQPEPDSSPLERIIKWMTEGRRHRATVAVTVPPETKVSVTAVSASTIVSGCTAGTAVTAVSGDVTLSSLRGEIDVKTVSGEIEAKDIVGGMKLKTVSGDVAVVDGSCPWVDAKTVSGDVLLDLDLDPSGTYDLTTVSGDVAVRTRSEPNLSVDLTSVSGDLQTDLGIVYERSPGRRHVAETIGTGGARLWIRTVSGDQRILRGREAAA